MDQVLLDVLQCVDCRGSLRDKSDSLKCSQCGRIFAVVQGFPIMLSEKMSDEVVMSQKMFDQKYVYSEEDFQKYITHLKTDYVFYNRDDLEKLPDREGGRFLELGCGGGVSGLVMAKKGYRVFGVDYSIGGLELSRRVFDAFGVTGYLVCADIMHTPFKDNAFDVLFGGGTLEHLEDTQSAVRELYRITKPEGYCINAVPVVSLSSMTYRQLSANIPEIPILKQIFRFVHVRVLRKRFMHTGYEKSFLERTLAKYHRSAGFADVKVEKYEFVPMLGHFPEWLRSVLRRLEKYRWFWTAVTVTAKKA